MGGMFSNEQFDAEYADNVELLTHNLYCPFRDCGAGSHAIEVLRQPNPDGWWTRQGRARCEDCGREFPIEAEPE